MTEVNIHQARTQLSKLIELAEKGAEVVIACAGKRIARLTLIGANKHGRRCGALKGKATDDSRFFDPLAESELSAWE